MRANEVTCSATGSTCGDHGNNAVTVFDAQATELPRATSAAAAAAVQPCVGGMQTRAARRRARLRRVAIRHSIIDSHELMSAFIAAREIKEKDYKPAPVPAASSATKPLTATTPSLEELIQDLHWNLLGVWRYHSVAHTEQVLHQLNPGAKHFVPGASPSVSTSQQATRSTTTAQQHSPVSTATSHEPESVPSRQASSTCKTSLTKAIGANRKPETGPLRMATLAKTSTTPRACSATETLTTPTTSHAVNSQETEPFLSAGVIAYSACSSISRGSNATARDCKQSGQPGDFKPATAHREDALDRVNLRRNPTPAATADSESAEVGLATSLNSSATPLASSGAGTSSAFTASMPSTTHSALVTVTEGTEQHQTEGRIGWKGSAGICKASPSKTGSYSSSVNASEGAKSEQRPGDKSSTTQLAPSGAETAISSRTSPAANSPAMTDTVPPAATAQATTDTTQAAASFDGCHTHIVWMTSDGAAIGQASGPLEVREKDHLFVNGRPLSGPAGEVTLKSQVEEPELDGRRSVVLFFPHDIDCCFTLQTVPAAMEFLGHSKSIFRNGSEGSDG